MAERRSGSFRPHKGRVVAGMKIEFLFFLINPGDARNIGSCARALKTMGHPRLILVNPAEDHLSGAAKALAHKSEEVLLNAKVYETFAEACETENIDLVVGCTARHRKVLREYVDCRELNEFLHSKHQISKRVAIVFGNERTGLLNSEIEACDVLTTIPTAFVQPSLNLSQAVMLYSFLLSQSNKVQTADWRLDSKEPKANEYKLFRQAIGEILERLGIGADSIIYRKALNRIAFIPGADLRILQAIRQRIERIL
jgi:tRNA/rRNA methyltransferase